MCNFREEKCQKHEVSGYWKKISAEIYESNLGSINLDGIIRMLSFSRRWTNECSIGHSASPENCDCF